MLERGRTSFRVCGSSSRHRNDVFNQRHPQRTTIDNRKTKAGIEAKDFQVAMQKVYGSLKTAVEL